MAEFELLGSEQDETRLLRDRTSGYSVPLPGHPVLAPVPDGSPRYDVSARLRDLDVEHGFRLDTLPTALEPQALATALATAYANGRATGAPFVAPVSPRWRPAGVTGGAHSMYPLSRAADPIMEQLWLLVRPAPDGVWALYETTRFRTSSLDQIAWAHLRASTIDQHHWDPAHPRETSPRLWPDSSYALPSGKLDLTETAWREASAKAAELGPFDDEQTTALAAVLRELALNDQPPTYELHQAHLDECARRVARYAPPRAADILLRDLPACRTMHDLRGWAWQCAWAIGHRADRTDAPRPFS